MISMNLNLHLTNFIPKPAGNEVEKFIPFGCNSSNVIRVYVYVVTSCLFGQTGSLLIQNEI